MERKNGKWIKRAEEFLFPNRCPVCLDIVLPRGRLICDVCRDKFPMIDGPTCKKCGKPLEKKEKEFCQDCVHYTRSFIQAISLMPFQNEVVHRLIMQMKYKNARQLLDYPCYIMGKRYGHVVKQWGVECLIPVPIHPLRKRMRGFNQAEEIAYRLGEEWGIGVDCTILYRKKNTLPQKNLNTENRYRNLKDAFELSQDFYHRFETVMLVDDIYTTGSTVEHCTRVLLAGGVKRVYVAILASGYDME